MTERLVEYKNAFALLYQLKAENKQTIVQKYASRYSVHSTLTYSSLVIHYKV